MCYAIWVLARGTHLTEAALGGQSLMSVPTQVFSITVLFHSETQKEQWALIPGGNSWWNAKEVVDLGESSVASAVLLVAREILVFNLSSQDSKEGGAGEKGE